MTKVTTISIIKNSLWNLQTSLTEKELSKVTKLLQDTPGVDLRDLIMATVSNQDKVTKVLGLLDTITPHNVVTHTELAQLIDKPILKANLLACQYLGNLDILKKPRVAIVGSRHPTYSGRQKVAAFATALAQAGCTIISGGAIGIDTIANTIALMHGCSCAIVGSGIDNLYPATNARLFKNMELSENGLILSEFPSNSGAMKWHFPRRNYTIAALADFVLVVEAKENSGSLITANAARKFDVPVGMLDSITPEDILLTLSHKPIS